MSRAVRPTARRLLTGLLLASAACWPVLWLALGSYEALLMIAPLAALLAPLVLGRYVGEDAIERVRVRRSTAAAPPARRAKPASRRTLPRPARVLAPRGGLLLAASLATRPPPVSA
ncbi:MAG TPA: hypothetical protein VIL49_18145 [Capillimicrobium sp.]|jgi:hypothetical protein